MSTKINKACLELALHITSLESSGNEELTWLKHEFAHLLRDVPTVEELSVDFENHQDLECANPWLKELTDRFFN